MTKSAIATPGLVLGHVSTVKIDGSFTTNNSNIKHKVDHSSITQSSMFHLGFFFFFGGGRLATLVYT